MIIYVLDDGETWTLSEPTAVAITPEQLTRIEGGEKFYHVVPDWDERPDPMCGCMKCTKERFNPDPPEEAEDFFVQAGIAAAEALKEAKRNYYQDITKNIIDAQNKNSSIKKD